MSTNISTQVWDKATEAHAGGAIKLLGEIVCWWTHGETPLSKLRVALDDNGFDAKKLAKDLSPRNVFLRVKDLLEREGRIVNDLPPTDTHWHYQLNAKKRGKVTATEVATTTGISPTETVPATEVEETNDRFEFPFECIVSIGRVGGEVLCKDAALAEYLANLMKLVANKRTANDVTEIVKRICDQHAKENPTGDLFAFRPGGAMYFTAADNVPFITRVAACYTSLGGTFRRVPIPMGTIEGDESVKETVNMGIESMIHDFEYTVAQLDEATRKGTLEATAGRIETLREEIRCYQAFLGVKADGLGERLKEAEYKLKLKVIELSQAGGESEAANAAASGEPVATLTTDQTPQMLNA